MPPGAARSVCARGGYWPGILGGRIRNWGSEPQAAAVLPAGVTSTRAYASAPRPAWGRNDGCGPGEEEEEGSARQAGLLGVDAEAEAAAHFAARRAQGDAALPRRAGWPTQRRRQASKHACMHTETHAYTYIHIFRSPCVCMQLHTCICERRLAGREARRQRQALRRGEVAEDGQQGPSWGDTHDARGDGGDGRRFVGGRESPEPGQVSQRVISSADWDAARASLARASKRASSVRGSEGSSEELEASEGADVYRPSDLSGGGRESEGERERSLFLREPEHVSEGSDEVDWAASDSPTDGAVSDVTRHLGMR